MTTSTQSVLENVSDVICKVSKKLSLQVAPMLMSFERKNYMAIARSTGIKYHKVYVKKDDIVKQLIKLAQQYEIPFYEVRLDGAFATEDMIKFLTEERIHFTMRIAKNRVSYQIIKNIN